MSSRPSEPQGNTKATTGQRHQTASTQLKCPSQTTGPSSTAQLRNCQPQPKPNHKDTGRPGQSVRQPDRGSNRLDPKAHVKANGTRTGTARRPQSGSSQTVLGTCQGQDGTKCAAPKRQCLGPGVHSTPGIPPHRESTSDPLQRKGKAPMGQLGHTHPYLKDKVQRHQ